MAKYTSKRSFLNHLNVDRRYLAQYVSNKLHKTIPYKNIVAVIGFLFDELMDELLQDKPIIIGNFGKFIVKKLKPRAHIDIIHKRKVMSQGHKILRFQLNKDIKKILTNNLDIEKTFGED